MSHFQTELHHSDSSGRFSETLYTPELDQTTVLFLAPHGGQVEPNTEQIAKLLQQKFPQQGGVWYTTGIVNGTFNDAFNRWHTTSKTHSVTDFPLYQKLTESRYQIAIGIHVMSKEGIIIGGQTSTEIQKSIQKDLRNQFPSQPIILGQEQSSLAGLNPNNFVNTIQSGHSLHFELSRRISMEESEAFVDTISNWLTDYLRRSSEEL